ncbi:EF-hand domain-containing protein [Limibaculum sp. M0105]|uniref:EF-hand domain-containing protein n=1 Tax=Thermohalobaculum xanthum TaxID=2753746 RepID=A0A8J7SE70_9RHOB|nr:EF-hand domain-containing protein [Thermohalobaculum xanthum]MBK0397715.1 EF-hand domain-containing protein [Thermohalobaculum xanthum]
MKRTLLAVGGVLAIVAAVPLVAMAEGGKRGGHGDRHGGMMAGGHHGDRGGHGHKHGGKVRMLEMIETYDADGDGSVSQVEIDTFRADRLKTFDADGDGTLSLAEYEALWLDAMRERMVDRFQRHDADGDGAVTVAEFSEGSKYMVIMRDRNDDGVLNLDDVGRRGGKHGKGDGQGGMQKP